MANNEHTCMSQEPGRKPGCPAGMDQQPDSHWVCTDHFEWFGEVLHVANNESFCVGAWIDEKRSWKQTSAYAGNHRTFQDVKQTLEAIPEFNPPVSEEEISAAADRLQRMLKEMTDAKG